jgi:hypothetical protein
MPPCLNPQVGIREGGKRRINWGKKAFKIRASRIWWEIEMTFLDPARNNGNNVILINLLEKEKGNKE